MKVAHLDSDGGGTVREQLEKGRELEDVGKYKDAEKIYRSLIKRKSPAEQAFNRLMILLRKERAYAKEMIVINNAIEIFEAAQPASKHKSQSKIHKLSLSLGRSTGLIDRKGKSTYDPEPIATWKRRKDLLSKKIKSLK
ncbi:MAG: hypothetical protein EOO02_12335 [Chitinophagaceae bacterium]|nr:MAG: hypothetical protein EOO02_12335 [Chitinophagaceae bacterium]